MSQTVQSHFSTRSIVALKVSVHLRGTLETFAARQQHRTALPLHFSDTPGFWHTSVGHVPRSMDGLFVLGSTHPGGSSTMLACGVKLHLVRVGSAQKVSKERMFFSCFLSFDCSMEMSFLCVFKCCFMKAVTTSEVKTC